MEATVIAVGEYPGQCTLKLGTGETVEAIFDAGFGPSPTVGQFCTAQRGPWTVIAFDDAITDMNDPPKNVSK